VPTIDGLLAATALVHGLVVVTRDTRPLERIGVPCLNPWSV
jgi:toxin FitB